jgi:hypothetical protein
MLGKLCRLEKQRGLNSDGTLFSTAPLPRLWRQRGDPDEVYLRCERVRRGLRINNILPPMLRDRIPASGEFARQCCLNTPNAPAGTALNFAASIRCQVARGSLRAAVPFVTVVQIEKDLTHIAAMAGMASSHFFRRDPRGHLGTQIGHQLLD